MYVSVVAPNATIVICRILFDGLHPVQFSISYVLLNQYDLETLSEYITLGDHSSTEFL